MHNAHPPFRRSIPSSNALPVHATHSHRLQVTGAVARPAGPVAHTSKILGESTSALGSREYSQNSRCCLDLFLIVLCTGYSHYVEMIYPPCSVRLVSSHQPGMQFLCCEKGKVTGSHKCTCYLRYLSIEFMPAALRGRKTLYYTQDFHSAVLCYNTANRDL
ncbi:hypothetical protein O6H91_06G123400 [Diphasiastrum complanatum]|uniref:Uncharacterized protein n=1 Tax=Diphasiastrum complanatum TaxID=34168 RepID=A0ACC2DIN8_DIPCM|nr:hypothetical protein O6H91_06G123400 [Diphasiastrum complanatum]